MENNAVKTDVEELHEDVATLKKDLTRAVERAKERALTAPAEWSREHLAAAVGIAAGAGFLLGLLVRGRRD